MKPFEKATANAIIMGRLAFGCDLLEGLTDVCIERNIVLGRVSAIGAVQSARIGFYNQKSREYRFMTFDRAMEIAALTGNISLRDEKPFVHAHMTLSDEAGQTYGGHLAPGTVVFACEYVIDVFEGPRFERKFDEETGLALWKLGE
jgi:predicted DNA-binding protein with PD1-like motif